MNLVSYLSILSRFVQRLLSENITEVYQKFKSNQKVYLSLS